MINSTITAKKALLKQYFIKYPSEASRFLQSLPTSEILKYLKSDLLFNASEIFKRLNPEVAATLISDMDDELFKKLLSEIDPAVSARLLSRLDKKSIDKKINLLSPALAKEISDLLQYPVETAGFLMDPNIATFHPEDTVKHVLKKIRTIQDRRILNIYVLSDESKILNVIPLQEIAIAQTTEQLKNLPQFNFFTIQALSPRDEVVQLLEEQKLLSLPVVDMQNNLLGVIRYDALVNAAKQDATEDLQAMFGAGREERALSKVSFAIRKRLPWLEINLATAFLAAAVVGIFEDTIAKITVLAVFLPVVAGQSGNTGSQALAVTMRGLALREIRTRHWLQVAWKEIIVGFVNGCVVSITTGVIVYFWASSLGLALVIVVAMIISMVIAGMSGAVIPILLKSFGQDPASSSSIILTTVTDVVGFLSFLGLATFMIEVLHIS